METITKTPKCSCAKLLFWLVLLVVLAPDGKVWAEDCRETAMAQTDMNFCAMDDSKKVDAELDSVYQKLMAKISPKGREKLELAKKAWLNYRKEECEFDTFGSSGGSIHPMALSECYADLAVRQTQVLREQLDCEEGNSSCGSQ